MILKIEFTTLWVMNRSQTQILNVKNTKNREIQRRKIPTHFIHAFNRQYSTWVMLEINDIKINLLNSKINIINQGALLTHILETEK